MHDDAPDLGVLYDTHARQVWRTVARLGVDPAGVEDVVQEVFLTASERLAQFEWRSEPATWLVGIAVRLAANARRRQRPTLHLADEHADPSSAPDEKLQHRRDLRALEDLLGALPQEQREVVVLMDLEQLTAPQVAAALEVKLNTVYSRLRLGRAALARDLVPQGEEVS